MTVSVGLPTRDPFTGDPLVVTAVENPRTGTQITGRFDLGWIGRLTPEQLDLVGLLLARRNSLQRLAADLGIAYNSARSRFEDIARALGDESDDERRRLRETLERLAAGEIDAEEAGRLLDQP